MKKIFTTAFVLLSLAGIRAQTPIITDNLMMPKKDLGVGVIYGNDSWKHYWEGTLYRQNHNVGIVVTQSAAFVAAYGLKEKITLFAMMPYVWTRAGDGVLTGLKGFQDLTLAGKYNFFSTQWARSSFSLIGLGVFSMPVTNYSKDFLPLSIGMGCYNLGGRLTANYSVNGWFATASGAYTWRSNVFLDRPAYYTNGHLFNTDEVQMPNMFDFIVRAGYKAATWHVDMFYTQQNTLGGGDIERQNTPFVSNRMNFIKVGVSGLLFVPHLKNFAVRAWGDYTVAGRNVGQSTSLMGGIIYRIGPRSTQN